MRWPWSKPNSRCRARHLELGARGEQWAARHLRRQGYKILVRRYRCAAGEIDLICRDGDWLVFVEVKTRPSEQWGAPSEAVDQRKQRHISKVALDYLRRLNNPRVRFRFDVVEVFLADPYRPPASIRVLQNAFDLSEPFLY